jgi:putative oxidoreductase
MLNSVINKIPEFCFSHWLIRLPLIVVFLQQGTSKLPFSVEDAADMELPALVWWFVVYGEIGAGLGLLVSGIMVTKIAGTHVWDFWIQDLGDLLTRFSGIVMCCIMTGVIWTLQPENLIDFIIYDPFHVMLWVGGLFFALRGSRT